MAMRFLVIYAHPNSDSFGASLLERVLSALKEAGHEVETLDLYASHFQPVMSTIERRSYYDLNADRGEVKSKIDQLLRCEGLIFVFPTWWYGMPAILKGYLDRVWLPGVAFSMDAGRTRPLLRHIIRFAAVTTYGSPWWLNRLLIGDPNRKVLMRGVRHLFSPAARTLWLAQYGMDRASFKTREKFLRTVHRRLKRL
jgi:putative NADPH-quinone reductase